MVTLTSADEHMENICEKKNYVNAFQAIASQGILGNKTFL